MHRNRTLSVTLREKFLVFLVFSICDYNHGKIIMVRSIIFIVITSIMLVIIIILIVLLKNMYDWHEKNT